ncbi:MAG: WD40/YVTN/BNR-like repeat-containing protein [Acidobacteriota bacterium]
MRASRRLLFPALVPALVMGAVTAGQVAAQAVDPATFSGLHWRLIGPFRGGRAVTAAGVRGQPDVFYFGSVGGGVWKTANAGRTWEPIFDGQPVGSIGAIAVAPSNPNVIYVGTGEADMRSQISYGNGVYRSADAGKTWTHLGLDDTQQIGRILVDPHDPDRVVVAALGHAYGPNEQRGVFRSDNGGKTWQRCLFKGPDVGAIDLAFDPRDPRTIYATLWATRRPPWNIYPPSNGPGSGLYKSTDGGDTWQPVAGHGLPSDELGRIGIAVAPSRPDRVYLIVDAKHGGLYRSDDRGASWRLVDGETRIWQRGWYFGSVEVDPKDPDTVYVMNTAMYRSRDGGATFDAIKGAPGGDDYHSLWLDPDHPERMITATDQGVVVTVDGARTWSSWYNQPTGQFYHVAADNGFPSWVYGAQQDSGAAGTPTRSSHRGITFRDWAPSPAGGEAGNLAPDPLDPDVVFGGTVERWDRRTGEVRDVSPELAHPGEYRHTWTLPLVFGERDPHELYFSHQVLFRTADGGQTWQVLSPDLTREDPGVPANLDPSTAADAPAGTRRGVIYTIAPSPLVAGEIWVGTDDGLIQVTRDDGKSWRVVTPPGMTAWSKVAMIAASRFDPETAYAAVDRHRLEDYRPHLYRTHDGGATWAEVTAGMPANAYLNCIREDPVRRGLLYAGTELGVVVSFDDGNHWQSLQLNLPAVSVRDLAIHDDDLIAATHGRSFWVIDDISPLREVSAQVAHAGAYLFTPRKAWRERPGSDDGTPLPPDEPAAENPPSGAPINYYLRSTPGTPVVIEILGPAGTLVRRYASDDPVKPVNPATLQFAASWVRPAPALSSKPGMHRWMWDLHHTARPGAEHGGGYGGWRRVSGGPWAMPGTYTVRLTVDGISLTRPLTVAMDPRVKTPLADLARQFAVSSQVAEAQAKAAASLDEGERLLREIGLRRNGKHLDRKLARELAALEETLRDIVGPEAVPFSQRPGAPHALPDSSSLRHAGDLLGTVYAVVQGADTAPSPDAMTAFDHALALLHAAEKRLGVVKTLELPRLDARLRRAGLAPIAGGGDPGGSR